MSEKKKNKSVNIADYLVGKNGTKYLKIQCSPKADAKTKKLVDDLKKLLGTDVLYVNLFTDDFREQYGIPDFSKGRIALPLDKKDKTESDPKSSKDEVDF
jgi:hypothetical protein